MNAYPNDPAPLPEFPGYTTDPVQTPPAVMMPQRKLWPLLPHDSLFAWITLPLGFLAVRYLIAMADGYVTTLFFWLYFAVSSWYLHRLGARPRPGHRVLGAVICLFAAVFSLTAAPLLHGLCAVFLLTAIPWYTQAVRSGVGFVSRYFPLDLLAVTLKLPNAHFAAGPQALSASLKKSKGAGNVKTVLLSLLITIPLTCVVGALLACAVSGVEQFLNGLLEIPTAGMVRLFIQLLCAFPAGCWLFAGLYGRHEIDDDAHAAGLAGARLLPNLGLYAGVTPVYLLYLVYVVSQLNYFISAFTGRLPGEMLYSEYARRGFFELCAIAVINLFVILILSGCAKEGGTKKPKTLVFYVCTLCTFTLFIIATALAKMLLYIGAYGLTPLRLYTAWFMVLLAVVFLVLAAGQFTQRLHTAATLTAAFLVLFAGLCFARPDALIARYNIARYEQGTLSELDVRMLLDLSDDALVVMADHPDTIYRAGGWEMFCREAGYRQQRMQTSPETGWNLSGFRLQHLIFKEEVQ